MIRQRVVLGIHDRRRDRVKLRRGNDVARVWSADPAGDRIRVVKLGRGPAVQPGIQQAREIAGPLIRGVDRSGADAGRRIQTSSLVIGEEEHLVLLDRTAGGGAETVPANCGSRVSLEIVAPIVGVQFVVAEELKRAAVELIRAGLGGGVDHSAHVVAEFGRGGQRDFIEFLDRFNARRVTDQVIGDLIVVQAVEHEIVGLFAIPIHIGTPAGTGHGAALKAGWIGMDAPGS